MSRFLLWEITRLAVGSTFIVIVLKTVSGDDHIHVGAPTLLLALWFFFDLIRYMNQD